MITIRNAVFRRILDRGGQRYAEVELSTDQAGTSHLLAYFRKEGHGGYQLVRIMANDSTTGETEAHGSYGRADEDGTDVTTLLFAGPSHGASDDRARFGHQILDYGDIREQLDNRLH